MPSKNPKTRTPEPTIRLSENAFTGEELGLPMVRTVTASQDFNAGRVSWHSHQQREILMLLRGATAYEFKGGAHLELAGNHVMVIPPRLLHRGVQDVRMPSVVCAISFNLAHPPSRHSCFTKRELAWISAQFDRRTPIMQPMSSALRRMAHSLHQMIHQQRKSPPSPDGIAALRLLVASIILEVARQSGGVCQPGTVAAVVHVTAHMERHYHHPIQMNDLAEHAGCSRARLFAIFKRETGMSPNDWLQRLRVKKAGELLAQTNRTLEDIAATVGFSSSQYFCHVFGKYSGTSPGEHRRKQKCGDIG